MTRGKQWVAFAYGFGMALTFDEFGMWLHLGGSYWQRGSFDAVIVILSLFGVIAFLPPWERFRSRHWVTVVGSFLAVAGFYATAALVGEHKFDNKYAPKLLLIEKSGPQ